MQQFCDNSSDIVVVSSTWCPDLREATAQRWAELSLSKVASRVHCGEKLKIGVSYNALKTLNPWLRTGRLPSPQDRYCVVRLPLR